jgi:hypothetical protein
MERGKGIFFNDNKKIFKKFKKLLCKYFIPTIMITLSIFGAFIIFFALLLKTATLNTAAKGSNGVVSTDSTTCSQIGVNILAIGGNAFDAGIAAAFCLGTIRPFASGIYFINI